MTSEGLFLLAIVAIGVAVFVIVQAGLNRHRIKRAVLNRLNIGSGYDDDQAPQELEQPVDEDEPPAPAEEDDDEAELRRLQDIIEDRKQLARNTDISYHLWSLYRNQFRSAGQHSTHQYHQDGKWYDLKILHIGKNSNLNEFEFDLNGARYKFVDDEEQRGWFDTIKFFSLFLYDDSGRCLIEIPMKVKADKWGRKYSILSDGPKAFLHGDWVNDFVRVTLKHQHIRNREIREQKHLDRLSEIADLKDRFGISN